jgi:hypothetical protein
MAVMTAAASTLVMSAYAARPPQATRTGQTGGEPSAARARPSSAAPARLDVSCSTGALKVSGRAATATSSGVVLRVSSTAPARTYLNVAWHGGDDGGGGEPIPAEPAVWTVTAPPGELRLSCSTSAKQGSESAVTVSDPRGYWRRTTVEDLGCDPGATPSWAIDPRGRGPSAEAAVKDMVRRMSGAGDLLLRSRSVTVRQAEVGYVQAATATWLVAVSGRPYLTASVTRAGPQFAADPGRPCGR